MPSISTTLTLANSACFISRYKFKGVGGTAIGSSQPCGTSATHAYRKWTWIHWLVSKRWIAGTLLEIRRAMIPPNGSINASSKLNHAQIRIIKETKWPCLTTCARCYHIIEAINWVVGCIKEHLFQSLNRDMGNSHYFLVLWTYSRIAHSISASLSQRFSLFDIFTISAPSLQRAISKQATNNIRLNAISVSWLNLLIFAYAFSMYCREL